MELINDFSKLSSEVLGYLGINNTYFEIANGITTTVKPLYIERNSWEIISASKLPNTGNLIIEFSNNEKTSVECSVLENKTEHINSYTLSFTNKLNSPFLDKLSKVKNINAESEQRREERYLVGLAKWKEFGLSHPETFLVHNSINCKCIINNVSVHGVLLTGETASISKNEVVNFICEFENFKSILQSALIVNCQNLVKNYSRYSLQFLDPISLTWQERLIEYSRNK